MTTYFDATMVLAHVLNTAKDLSRDGIRDSFLAVRNMETISGKAQALGTYEVFHGDFRKLFDAPAEYESITADEVRTAAASVLRRENRTMGSLVMPAETTTPPAPAETRQ